MEGGARVIALLLSSTLAAQQGAGQTAQPLTAQQMSANVSAAARRMADCALALDLNCYQAMLDPTRRPPARTWPDVDTDPREIRAMALQLNEPDFFRRVEMAEPWPPIALDGVIFSFVPTFSSYGVERLGLRVDLAAYLIGVSEDGGRSWRFVDVSRYPQTRPDAVDQLMPGYGDGPRPEVRPVYVEESPFETSPWLQTTGRRLGSADEGFVYDLKFEIRRRIRDPIDLTVQYDNPADRGQQFRFDGSLQPGQRELQWKSPVLQSFEAGETYNVVIEGSDPATGALLFEHRESLLFQPTRELWLAAVPQPPPSRGSDGSVLDVIARDAERYAVCWQSGQPRCLSDLSDRELFDETGLSAAAFSRHTRDAMGVPLLDFYNIELMPPWEPFAAGDRLVSYVPYFETIVELSTSPRYELMAYLVATSYDNGSSWRFLKIEGMDAPLADQLERLLPGAAERPEPAIIEEYVEEPELAISRSLRTRERRFMAVDDGFIYSMKWELRRESDSALDLAIQYDDPADRSQPLTFQGSLEPGQLELEWLSPVLTGFEPGQEYTVVVAASDPETGELLFEHRQPVLFQPTRERWRVVMSESPSGQTTP
jgi:hypothetical protein